MVLNTNDYAFAKTAKELYGINIGYGASNTVILDNCLERTSNSGALSDAIANWSNGFKGYSKKYDIKQGGSLNYVTESDLSDSVFGSYRVLTYQ